MRHSATVCETYQTTDVAYLNGWELWKCQSGVERAAIKKDTLLCPTSGHYGDHTEHKGNDRKEHRCKTLDKTLCQAVNAER